MAAWVRERGEGSDMVPLTVPDIAARLQHGDDPPLVPVPVTWLPAGGPPALARRPGRRRPHPRLAASRAGRAAADRACRTGPLPGRGRRARHRGRVGDRLTEVGGGSLPEFVRLQATVALQRAERAVTGQQYKIPQLVYEEITGSARYRSGIQELAGRLELPPEDVDRRARRYPREMVASQSRRAIDARAQLGAYFSRAYEIDVARPGLDHVRRLGPRHSLVFLPSHRSYLDPLVLRPALLRNGFPPNHVLSGINLSFWPLGPLARRSGFVFIRRSFAGNEIYKWALCEYLGYLLRKRFNLEWYIEGGRSRTGKLRPPRYGLLTYLAEAFPGSGVDDVCIVPVSISYDQLYEVGAMAAEARGAAKKAESLSWLVGYVRAQGSQQGQVHLAFGEPLSLAGALGSDCATLPPAELRRAVQKIGIEVMHRIDSVTPVTAAGLVTLCLLGLGGRALTVAEIKAVLVPLLGYVRRRNLPTAGELRLDRAGVIRQVLQALVSMGVVTRYDKGTDPVYQVAENQQLVAAFYRNNIIHFLINRAVTELVLQAAAEEHYGDPAADGWQEALRLRDLLKFEFFFSDKSAYGNEIRSELALIDEQWAERLRSPDVATRLLEQARPHLAHRILEPYLEAYLVVAGRLAARPPREPVADKAFVQECLDVARQLLMQQRITSSESLSSELFSTGLRLARNRGLADPGGQDVAARRAAFADELGTLVRRLHRSRALALSDLGPRTRRHPGDRRSRRRPDRGQVRRAPLPPPGPRRPAPRPGISRDRRRGDPGVHRRRAGRAVHRGVLRPRRNPHRGLHGGGRLPRPAAPPRHRSGGVQPLGARRPGHAVPRGAPGQARATSRSRRSPGGWKTSWTNSANGCSGRTSPAGSTRRRASSSTRTARPGTGSSSRHPRRRSRPIPSPPTWALTPCCARARRCRPGCSPATWTATSCGGPARHGPSPATPTGRASASPAASPTATAPRTCRCSKRSAIRGR